MFKTNHRVEVILGRTLAACRYPVTAWGRFSIKWRVAMVTAYAAASYVTVLGVLLALDS